MCLIRLLDGFPPVGLESGSILQDGLLPFNATVSYPLTVQMPLGL